jgi:hypothetical protein
MASVTLWALAQLTGGAVLWRIVNVTRLKCTTRQHPCEGSATSTTFGYPIDKLHSLPYAVGGQLSGTGPGGWPTQDFAFPRLPGEGSF